MSLLISPAAFQAWQTPHLHFRLTLTALYIKSKLYCVKKFFFFTFTLVALNDTRKAAWENFSVFVNPPAVFGC